MVDKQQERLKRDLRLRIGRLRRQIDARLHQTGREAKRLAAWRTYVEHYSGSAVVAALGAGLALWVGLRRGRLRRWLGVRLMRRAGARAARLLRKEIARLWAGFISAGRSTEPKGADHGQG